MLQLFFSKTVTDQSSKRKYSIITDLEEEANSKKINSTKTERLNNEKININKCEIDDNKKVHFIYSNLKGLLTLFQIF